MKEKEKKKCKPSVVVQFTFSTNAVCSTPYLFAMSAVRRKGYQTHRDFSKWHYFKKVESIPGLQTELKQHDAPRKAQLLPKESYMQHPRNHTIFCIKTLPKYLFLGLPELLDVAPEHRYEEINYRVIEHSLLCAWIKVKVITRAAHELKYWV